MTTTPPAPVATGHTDASPCPRIDAEFTPPAGVVTYTIYRTSSAGKDPVRGAVRKPVAAVGAVVVTDFEAPFGVACTYTVVGYDAAGVPSAESPASNAVTLEIPAGCPWVIDPSNPSTAMVWSMTEWPGREFKRDQAALWPLVSDRAVVVTGRRTGPHSSVTVLTRSTGEESSLLALADTPVVQLRTPSSWYYRGGFFTIDKCEQAPFYDVAPADPTQLWELELIPAGRPDPALFLPVYTWADVLALYATWADVAAAKATWLSVLRNPDPAAGP